MRQRSARCGPDPAAPSTDAELANTHLRQSAFKIRASRGTHGESVGTSVVRQPAPPGGWSPLSVHTSSGPLRRAVHSFRLGSSSGLWAFPTGSRPGCGLRGQLEPVRTETRLQLECFISCMDAYCRSVARTKCKLERTTKCTCGPIHLQNIQNVTKWAVLVLLGFFLPIWIFVQIKVGWLASGLAQAPDPQQRHHNTPVMFTVQPSNERKERQRPPSRSSIKHKRWLREGGQPGLWWCVKIRLNTVTCQDTLVDM